MSSLIRCDNCNEEFHEDPYRASYFTLERSGGNMPLMNEEPGPWHFDTWRCIMQFANAKDRTRADGL